MLTSDIANSLCIFYRFIIMYSSISKNKHYQRHLLDFRTTSKIELA